MKANFYIFPTLMLLSTISQGLSKSRNTIAYKLLFIVDAKKNLLFNIFIELCQYAYFEMQPKAT